MMMGVVVVVVVRNETARRRVGVRSGRFGVVCGRATAVALVVAIVASFNFLTFFRTKKNNIESLKGMLNFYQRKTLLDFISEKSVFNSVRPYHGLYSVVVSLANIYFYCVFLGLLRFKSSFEYFALCD
jgi:hypothetical protein